MNFPRLSPIGALESPPTSMLVVEDEVLIRFTLADYLRDCGFHVVEAADASEAIALLQASETIIDLVFSDVHMPGELDGFGLARWLRSTMPDVLVILTSGVARTADLGEELCGLGPIETKPYHLHSLADRMRRVLAGKAPASAQRMLRSA